MRNVKAYLKRVGITQSELALRLGLSRPTLDTYISMFENGIPIPKERYSIIFDELFNGVDDSMDSFNKKLMRVETLLDRDYKYGLSDYDVETADLVSEIIGMMKNDMKMKGWNENIYSFIRILMSNYRENTLLKNLAEYFVYLTNIRDIDSVSDEQKPFFANFHKTFCELEKEPQYFSIKDYENFVHRCYEIKREKVKSNRDKEKSINERIRNLIAEYEKMGIELSEEEIINRIREQLLRERLS